MRLKILVSALALALPASLLAQSITATHEIVTVPGKTIVQVRPLVQHQSRAVKCHPDASKSVTCEAHARVKRAEALASAQSVKATRLSER